MSRVRTVVAELYVLYIDRYQTPYDEKKEKLKTSSKESRVGRILYSVGMDV